MFARDLGSRGMTYHQPTWPICAQLLPTLHRPVFHRKVKPPRCEAAMAHGAHLLFHSCGGRYRLVVSPDTTRKTNGGPPLTRGEGGMGRSWSFRDLAS